MKSESTWFRKHHDGTNNLLVAYFSAEFGVTDCLSIFAGGLGILAGDHLKSASDLGVPLVAVGLLYQQGYFRQYLNEAGLQQEEYRDNDFHNLPLTLERDRDGKPLIIEVEYPGRKVAAQIWRAQVGRVALYLLDTNIKQNSPQDQDITDQLYGGDAEMRLKQELMMGIGGCRALEALGIQPSVYHLNEGHSAFLALEAGAIEQRREPAARASHASDVARVVAWRSRRRDPHQLHSQRCSFSIVDLAGNGRALRPLSRAAMARGARRSSALGARGTHLGRRALANARTAARTIDRICASPLAPTTGTARRSAIRGRSR
jgi:hypothetical protein